MDCRCQVSGVLSSGRPSFSAGGELLRVSGFGFRFFWGGGSVWGLGFGVSGFGVRDSGFGCGVSGFGVSGFGIRDSGLRLRGGARLVRRAREVRLIHLLAQRTVLEWDTLLVRAGSWMGPPQGKRAPRVGPIRGVILARE